VARSTQLVARGSRTVEGHVEKWGLLRLTEPRSAASAFRLVAILAMVALGSMSFTGCESTYGGGSVSGSMYYGTGFHDPWYYGGYYNSGDIIVTPPTPPPDRPVARPTPLPAPAPRPRPSIPLTPRGGVRR